MPDTDTPWEPPLAGTETEQLFGALDRLRTTFRWKAGHLDAAGLQTRIGTSSLTLGGLLKHLAANEDFLTTVKLSGAPMGAPWEANGWDGDDDWEFTSAADDPPEELYALWDGAVARSRARLTRRRRRRWSRPARPRRRRGRGARQPAPARLRPDRGVRTAHRARRPAPRGRRRGGRRGPAPRLAPLRSRVR